MVKRRILGIAFLLIIVMMLSAFAVACGGDEKIKLRNTEEDTEDTADQEQSSDSSESESESEEETEEILEELDDSMFNIFHNKKYLCTFVWPNNPTADEKYVAKQLKTLMNEKTGKQITFVTEDKVPEDSKFIVLLGNTGYAESKDLYKKIGDREAMIEIVDNKLVIAFDNRGGGAGVVRKMMQKLSNRQTLRLSFSYTAKYTALPEIDKLPEYTGGTAQEIDCGQDTTMKLIKSSSASALAEYAQAIESAEFEKVSDRTVEGNVFYTYRTDMHYIYMYYTKYSNETRIIIGPIESWCEEDYSSSLKGNYTPYIASIPQSSDAQGYIFRLADGRFIIQDGGLAGEDRVYSALKKLEPSKDIVIAAWFISHPHADHYPALIDFIRDHGRDKDVSIERIIHNYVHEDEYRVVGGTAGDENCTDDVKDFYTNLNRYIPDVPLIKAHTGQVMNFGSMTIEVLYTHEDMLPEKVDNINATSFVFRATVDGQTIMMLADTYVKSANILCNMWGNYLKSDIVQIAHHGVWPATAELYHKIQGKLVIVPTGKTAYSSYVDDSRWKDVTNAYLKYATDIELSIDEMFKLELPYVFKNDINQKLEQMKK